MHSCPDAPSSRTHTDTNMPSDMDTKADWGSHRYADAQRRSHMQTQPRVQMQTYPQRQARLFLEQNSGNLPISPIPQMIDLIYPPIHCPPIYLAIHSPSHPLTLTCFPSSLHSNLLSSLQAHRVPEGNKENFPGTQPRTLPTSIQGWGVGHLSSWAL